MITNDPLRSWMTCSSACPPWQHTHDISPPHTCPEAAEVEALQARVRELEGERDSYRHQAEYERQARIDAANFPRNRHGYIPCGRCGLDCGMDAILPTEVWHQIAPYPDYPDGGMYCLWCMDELCAEKGLTALVRVYFVGKSLRSELYADEGGLP